MKFKKALLAKIQIYFTRVEMAVGVWLMLLAATSTQANNILWSNTGGTAWISTGNWTGSVIPGTSDNAQFGVNPTGSTTVGVNMASSSVNNGANNEGAGAIEVTSTRVAKLTIGDSSSTSGTLTLFGTTVNGVANVIIRNANSAGKDLVIQDNGGGTGLMTLALANTTENIVSLDVTGGSGNITIADVISSSSGTTPLTFTGSGSGAIAITGTANTWTGNIKITGAEVDFSAAGSFGNSANTITIDGGRLGIASGASIDISTRSIFLGATAGTSISAPGAAGVLTYNGVIADKSSSTGILVKQGAGTLSLGGVSTFSGNVSINNGTVKLTSGDNRLPTSTTVNLGQSASANLGTLDLNGNNQTVAGLVSTSGINATTSRNTITNSSGTTVTLTLGGSGSYAYGAGTTNNSGIIAGPINLVVSGSGTQTLGDTNSYSGNTTITNTGTLALSGTGAITNTPQVAIAAGATFDVSAAGFSFTGVNPVQTLAGGSSSGTANVNATGKTVTLASGAKASFHVVGGGSPTAGKISVAGALTLNANVVTVNIDSGTLGAGTYRLLDCTGTLTGTANSTPTITGLGSILSGASVSISTTPGAAGHIDLVVTKAMPTFSLISSANPSGYKTALTFAANSFAATVSGTVQFITNGINLGSPVTISGNSASSIAAAGLPRGTTNIVWAVYSGDANYLSITNTLTETVTNHPPVASANTYTRNGLSSWKIAISDLLTNASDVIDGDVLSLDSILSNTSGVILVISNGYVLYINNNLVDDTFTYTVIDGFGGTNTAIITLTAGSTNGIGGQASTVAFTGGIASVSFSGIPTFKYNVQVSTNLMDWNTIWTTNAPANGLFRFDDNNAPTPAAYYRLMWNGN